MGSDSRAPVEGSGGKLRAPAAGVLLLALAAVLRAALLGGKPFWADEAWVAWLVELPLGEMLATIPKTTAPLGFALATRLAARLPGLPPEIAMRLLPLAAGIATVALLPLLVRRFGGSRRAAWIAMALATALPPLVKYSRELKPYAIDALIATAFPIAVMRLLDAAAAAGPGRMPLRVRLLPAAIALASPFLSFGGAFPIAATLAWAWAQARRRRFAPARGPLLAATVPFLAVAATLALTLLLHQAANPVLRLDFGTATPRLAHVPAAIVQGTARLIDTSFTHLFAAGAAAAMLVAAGGLLGWPRGRRLAAATVAFGSVLLAAVAAAAGLYVVTAGRLVLFAAPYTVAAVAVGLDRATGLFERGPRTRRAPGIALALAVGSLALFWSWLHVAQRFDLAPPMRGAGALENGRFDTSAALAALARRRGPGEPVLVGPGLRHTVRYYARPPLDPPVALAERSRHARVSLSRRLAPWLAGVPDRGWVLIRRGRLGRSYRAAIERSGFAVAETAFGAALLWEVTRQPGP